MANSDYPERIFHCQNPECGQQFVGRYRSTRQFCPDCVASVNGNASLLARRLAQKDKPMEVASFPPIQHHDKKEGGVDWRKMNGWIAAGQAIRQESSWAQEAAEVTLGDGTEPIAVGTLSDLHIGAWGSDYERLEELTDQILSIPNFYILLLGDELEWAVKLRSVAEVTNQILPPKLALRYFENWFETISPKVICGTWDNHEQERSEKAVGVSLKEEIVAKKTVFFNGIGHLNVKVGEQTYKLAVSHKFPGYSYLNPGHAPMRYMRMVGSDREACMMGDIHTPFLAKYVDGPSERVVLVAGSTHTNSSYAKRYFTLVTHPQYPLVELRHDRHEINPFWNVMRWVEATNVARPV